MPKRGKSVDFTVCSDAIFVVDAEDCILSWNHEAEILFGFTCDQVLGKHFHKTLVPSRCHDPYLSGMRHFRITSTDDVIKQRVRLPVSRRDGTEFSAELVFCALSVGGRWQAIACVKTVN